MSPVRSGKSGIARKRRWLSRRLKRDTEILAFLLRSKGAGLTIAKMMTAESEPLLVYGDYPFPLLETPRGSRMPPWDDLTPWFKLQLFVLVMSEWKDRFLTYNVNIHDYLTTKVARDRTDIRQVVRDRLRKEIIKAVGEPREFVFVVEGLSRKTKVPTNLHIHGGVRTMDEKEQEQLLNAAGRAAGQGIKGHSKENRSVHGKVYYGGNERWGNYLFKFVKIKDERLAERRLVMSQSAIAAGREFWNLITGRWPDISLDKLKSSMAPPAPWD